MNLLGMSEALPPFRFVRPRPNIAQVLVCHAGAGHVLIDGQWVPCRAGQAYVTPRDSLHAYQATGRRPWRLGWVTFDDSKLESGPRGPARIVDVDPDPILRSIQGLYAESIGLRSPDVLHHWLQLVHAYTRRIAQPPEKSTSDPRLRQLWTLVDSDLSRNWTLADLSKCVHLSPEQLRRLCQITLGRSPIRQVTRLRMERAASLLTATERKISDIAGEVGYRDAFAFSTAFAHWSGTAPTAFRNGVLKP